MPFVTVLGDSDHVLAVEIIVEEKMGALSHPEEYPFNEGRIVAERTFGVWRPILKDFGGMERLELSWVSPPPPQDGVSASSTTHPHIKN
jgi:hypothetical protein